MIASGTSSRLATDRPMIITTAIATASVKSSYSPTGLPLKRVRRRTVTEWPAYLVGGYPLNMIQAAMLRLATPLTSDRGPGEDVYQEALRTLTRAKQ